MNQISVPIIKLPNASDLPLPKYPHDLASGMDVAAAVNSPVRLSPRERLLIPTGLCLALPLGVEAQIRTHPETALGVGLVICDSPAAIDPAFRDEVKCLVLNTSDDIIIVKRGMHIASMAFSYTIRADWQEMPTQ